MNVDWFFLSHRLPIARAARDRGLHVTVAAADTGRGEEIRQERLDFVALPFSRQGMGPLGELRTLISLWRLYQRLRPDVVHHVTIKPVIYGSLAVRLGVRVPVVNAISGLGYIFSSESRAPWLRRVVQRIYRVALGYPRSRTIFQNPDDRDQFVGFGLIPGSLTTLIRGSGVDCARFVVRPEPEGEPLVVLPSRMLWDKGIQSFVDAAAELRRRGVSARFALVGGPDDGNPTSIPAAQLREWEDAGLVEWWGNRTDMPDVLAQSSIVVLPSVREGLPKALLEAAACGRPMIATDVPGCREVVRPGVNGILVPPGDSARLAAAIESLLVSPDLRSRFGAASRQIAEREFAEEIVVEETMNLYRSLLGMRWPEPPAVAQ